MFGRKEPPVKYLPSRPSPATWLDLYRTHLNYLGVDAAIIATDKVFKHIENRQVTVYQMELS